MIEQPFIRQFSLCFAKNRILHFGGGGDVGFHVDSLLFRYIFRNSKTKQEFNPV
jgi:hypothetical protein